MPIFDVFPLLNDRDLLAMHDGVKRAMQEDDKHPKNPPYGVREHGDFKTHTDELERVLRERGTDFDPIDWSPRKSAL